MNSKTRLLSAFAVAFVVPAALVAQTKPRDEPPRVVAMETRVAVMERLFPRREARSWCLIRVDAAV